MMALKDILTKWGFLVGKCRERWREEKSKKCGTQNNRNFEEPGRQESLKKINGEWKKKAALKVLVVEWLTEEEEKEDE